MAILSWVIKGGVAVYACKVTKDQGVWGNSDKTLELKNKICKQISPYIETGKAHLPFAIPELPAKGSVGFISKHYYNEGVKNTIYFIHRFPCYLGMGFKKVKDSVSSAMNSFEQSPEPLNPKSKN